jgi:hypothetical protein
MTNHRGSTTARLVQAKTGEQLFERTQEHIRPLIGMIDAALWQQSLPR